MTKENLIVGASHFCKSTNLGFFRGNFLLKLGVTFGGSSLLFMLNQQTRCQDNILLTQKFRKFLKP
ncbi:MAG: hypothetical protein EWV82_16695 [Microcystis aeruginosa Ma_AC_P_19900807_S299]|nr:MAG: hypothetical protein EWV82_16695 [Microcystis aeruginosa Ma_AC_P_19900807_S299]